MRIARTAALVVIALAVIAGGVAWFWHQATPVNAPQSGTVTVSAILTTESGPLAADDVHVFEVNWRGLSFPFKRSINDRARDVDGMWEARINVSDIEAWQAQHPNTPDARVHLRGTGFAKLEGKQGITRGTLAAPNHLKLQIHLATAAHQARLVLLDGAGRPTGPATLYLSLQYQVDGRNQQEGREVKVGEDGRARLDRVEFPLTVFVSSCEGVSESEFLITPDMHRPVTLDDSSKRLFVRKKRIRAHSLTIADTAMRRQVVEAARKDALLFALFPTQSPSAPFRPVWSVLEHSLDADSRRRLQEDGKIWLGELPEGRYWLAVFTRDGINASLALQPPSQWGGELSVTLRQAAGQATKRRVLGADGRPVPKSLVLAGYYPHFLLPRIREIAASPAADEGALSAHFGFSAADGSVSIAGDCEYYTVLTEDRRAFHVKNTGESITLSDAAEDGVATVKVVGKDGKPLAGVVVNFSSTDTSPDDDYAPWPLAHELCNWWVTNSAGVVEIRGLMPMTYVLSVAHNTESAKGRHFSVDGSSVRLVRVEPGAVSLSVTAGDALVEECEHCKEHDHHHDDKHSGD